MNYETEMFITTELVKLFKEHKVDMADGVEMLGRVVADCVCVLCDSVDADWEEMKRAVVDDFADELERSHKKAVKHLPMIKKGMEGLN
jgi:hypothetical protein